MSIYTDGYEPSFHDDPCDAPDTPDEADLTDYVFGFGFRDGSEIRLLRFDAPELDLPHRKSAKLWMAEEAANHIERNQLDNWEAEKYVKANFEKR